MTCLEAKIQMKSSIFEPSKIQLFSVINTNALNDNNIYLVDSSKRKYIEEEIRKAGKGNISSQIFSYHELSVATKNFHPNNMIGEGGFGRVYKGYIKSIDKV